MHAVAQKGVGFGLFIFLIGYLVGWWVEWLSMYVQLNRDWMKCIY